MGGFVLGLRSWLIFIFFATSLSTSPNLLLGGPHQIEPLLQSLRQTDYEFQYFISGLTSVSKIKFNRGVPNHFSPFMNTITVSTSMNDGRNRIKDFGQLGNLNFGTLAHEAFHAYQYNIVTRDSRYKSHKLWMTSRAQHIFGRIPEGKRSTALEEAYAVYLDNLVQSKIFTEGIFRRMTEENCHSTLDLVEKLWASTWDHQVYGYYYRDSFFEYWQDRFHGAWIYLSRGAEAYKAFAGGDDVIYTKIDLPDLDRKWIAANLLEGKISKDAKKTFERYWPAESCEDFY